MPRVSQVQRGRYNPPTDVPFYALRCEMERRYNLARVARLEVEGCMRVELGGGAYLDPAPSTVGAGEVRVTERLRVRPNRDEVSDYLRDDAILDRRGRGAYRQYNLPAWMVEVLYLDEVGSRWTGVRRVTDATLRSRVLDLLPSVEVAEVEVGRERSRSEVRPLDVSAERASRLRAIVGNADVDAILEA